jgi:hypothetical protein
MGAVGRFSVNLQVKPPVVLSGDMSIEKTYGDVSVTNYTASYATGIPPFTFTSSTSSVNSVCAPITGTYIGDGTNGTLGVSFTYEKFTGLQRCNWIIPQGVTSADYVVVGSGGGGGTGRGRGRRKKDDDNELDDDIIPNDDDSEFNEDDDDSTKGKKKKRRSSAASAITLFGEQNWR